MDSLEWTPLGDFIGLLRNQVPDHIFERCASIFGKTEGMEQHRELLTLQ